MLTISARVRGKRAARSPTGVVCGAGGDAGGRAGGGLGGGGDGGLVVTGTSFVPCEKSRSVSDTCSQACEGCASSLVDSEGYVGHTI